MSRHIPTRPGWTCSEDGQRWPGENCRLWLGAMYKSASKTLRAEMETKLAQAVADGLGKRDDLNQDELEARFLGWIRVDR